MNRPVLAALAALAAGCNAPITFEDDIDLAFDFGFFDGDDVHTPYVVGAPVRLTANLHRNGDGWTLESDDPGVFALAGVTFDDEIEELFSFGTAAGVGTTDVVVIDDRGRERDRVEIDVRAPTRLELHAAGARFAGLDAGVSLADAPQILVDGMATFQVEYFDGQEQLFGNAVLGAAPEANLDAEPDTTWLFENREWLRLTPHALGPQTVALDVGGDTIVTTTVIGVATEAVVQVDITGSNEAGAEEGDSLVLLAQAFDDAGVPIYGVEYAWDRDGAAEDGMGDLYRYAFDPAAETELTATFDDDAASVVIHGDGFVDSSNTIGCDSGRAGAGWWLALALLGVRRRR